MLIFLYMIHVMDIFSFDGVTLSVILALVQVVLIDLVMSGDNALMISVTTQ